MERLATHVGGSRSALRWSESALRMSLGSGDAARRGLPRSHAARPFNPWPRYAFQPEVTPQPAECDQLREAAADVAPQ